MLTVGNYHYIRENFTTLYPSIFGFTPEYFKKQLIKLNNIGCFVHPKDLIDDVKEIINSKKHYILISFDDGLREQFDLAKPILDTLKIPAIFFVNTINHIDKEVSLVHKIHLLRSKISPKIFMDLLLESDLECNINLTTTEKEKAILHYNYDKPESAYLKYLLNFKLTIVEQSTLINDMFNQNFNNEMVVNDLYMSTKQLSNLAKQDMLGSHSHSHSALAYLSPELIRKELETSKNYLEYLTQCSINCVSYPYGSKEACSEPVGFISKEVGYTLGFTMERGINTGSEHNLYLKRFDCNDLPIGKNEKVFNNEYSTFYK